MTKDNNTQATGPGGYATAALSAVLMVAGAGTALSQETSPTEHPFNRLTTATQHPYDQSSHPTQHPFDRLTSSTGHPYDEFTSPTEHPFDPLTSPTGHPLFSTGSIDAHVAAAQPIRHSNPPHSTIQVAAPPQIVNPKSPDPIQIARTAPKGDYKTTPLPDPIPQFSPTNYGRGSTLLEQVLITGMSPETFDETDAFSRLQDLYGTNIQDLIENELPNAVHAANSFSRQIEAGKWSKWRTFARAKGVLKEAGESPQTEAAIAYIAAMARQVR
jgi:hypothetical protein